MSSTPSRLTVRLGSTRVLAASLAALVLIALVFVTWPGIDLSVARVFAASPGHFAADTPVGHVIRSALEALPFVVFAAYGLLYGLRRFAGLRVWAPGGAGLVVMALSLALGPGLLVNGLLKDHSHRPRPIQVTAFGGPYPFRPFYAFDGGCARNCSFVSGEGASSAWLVVPALLAPPPWRAGAVAAAVVAAAATATLRIAFGGHFLSDSLFAAALTWLVSLACWLVVARLTRTSPDAPAP